MLGHSPTTNPLSPCRGLSSVLKWTLTETVFSIWEGLGVSIIVDTSGNWGSRQICASQWRPLYKADLQPSWELPLAVGSCFLPQFLLRKQAYVVWFLGVESTEWQTWIKFKRFLTFWVLSWPLQHLLHKAKWAVSAKQITPHHTLKMLSATYPQHFPFRCLEEVWIEWLSQLPAFCVSGRAEDKNHLVNMTLILSHTYLCALSSWPLFCYTHTCVLCRRLQYSRKTNTIREAFFPS